jgi:multidrug efflux pump subunit AcrB
MLSMAFESLRYPFAVIFMIPISFIGLFLTFGLSDFAFDQGGFAALVMLCGIVVNAGIYLVTTYQRFGGSVRLTKERQIRRFVKAFNHKIVPISLTIASTVFGLLPFLSDGPEEVFWFDFAIGTIGGLFFSVIALLFYLPVFVIDTGRKSTLFKHDPSKSHRG